MIQFTYIKFRSVALNLTGWGRVSKTRGKRFDSSPSCFGNEQKIVVIGHEYNNASTKVRTNTCGSWVEISLDSASGIVA